MTKEKTSIFEHLKEYSSKGIIPMHMPGHKRNLGISECLKDLGASYDITEIADFDDLHNPQGIIAEAMGRSSKLWHSKKSYFLVNGSTCGILAGIRSVTNYGDEIIVARNCHKSVYHAIELCGLKPIFIMPSIDEKFGIYTSIQPLDIATILVEHPKARLVVITSPTYEGVISDVYNIADIAHSKGIPVLVDEAHGAHLGFSPMFKGAAVTQGADIVIQSLHKTLPSLTQTAIAHLNGDLVDCDKFSHQLDIFETSSPSYLLIAAMDQCVNLLITQGGVLFNNWENLLTNFNGQMKNLSHLKVLMCGKDKLENHNGIYGFDPSKIVISTANTNLSAVMIKHILLRDYNIELEMASRDYAIAMTGLGDSEESIVKLAQSLLNIDKSCLVYKGEQHNFALPMVPQRRFSVAESMVADNIKINLSEARGRISAEYLWAYPPGVPLIIPGEYIDDDFIQAVKDLYASGVNLKSTYGRGIPKITVLK